MEEHEANVINRNEIQIHNTTSSINSELGKLLIQDDDNNKKDMEENEVNINNSNKLQMLNTTSSINSKFGKLLIQDDDNNKKDVEENEVNVNNSNELQMLNTTISHINDDFYYSEGENDSLYSNESNGGSAEV